MSAVEEVVQLTKRRYNKKPKDAAAAKTPLAKKQKTMSDSIQSSFAPPHVNSRNKKKRKRSEVDVLHSDTDKKPLIVHNVVAKAIISAPRPDQFQDIRYLLCGNFDEQKFPSCNIPFTYPLLTVGIIKYGQVGVTGGDTREDEALFGVYLLAYQLYKLIGLPFRVQQFRIVNEASSGCLGRPIDLWRFHLDKRKHTESFGDQFPGLKWSYADLDELQQDTLRLISDAIKAGTLSREERSLLRVPEIDPTKNKKNLPIILFASGKYNVVGLRVEDDEFEISNWVDCHLEAWTWIQENIDRATGSTFW